MLPARIPLHHAQLAQSAGVERPGVDGQREAMHLLLPDAVMAGTLGRQHEAARRLRPVPARHALRAEQADAAVMHVVLAMAEVVMADAEGDVGDRDPRVEVERRLDPHPHGAGRDAMGAGGAAEAVAGAVHVEMQVAGTVGAEDPVLEPAAGFADRLPDIQGEMPVAVAEADVVARQVQVPRGPPVMEADAEHAAARSPPDRRRLRVPAAARRCGGR
ncbi:hypothetical protein ACFQS7_03825 [Dankookia sp. GCM10030260]|uniref:hypothetical protein n=1 Tax=Dankookia sp. GCM10030260 TaxID=3273390 RepID=UPI00360A1FE7